ncbi:MAG: hypothetical protein U0R52_12800 [Solirubrobacterales bacterium]
MAFGDTLATRTAWVRTLAVAACLAGAGLLVAGSAGARSLPLRVVHTQGRIVPIPASVPHQAGAMIDSRLVGDLRYLASHYPIYVSEGYAGPLPQNPRRVIGCPGCHVSNSDHKNGMAVDIGPQHWSSKCDASWKGITRLAHWAEPVQNRPRAPFRWVGYDGDAGHGCGNHLHLSWNHAEARVFTIPAWVEVFRAGAGRGDGSGSGGNGGRGGPTGGLRSGRLRGGPPPASGGIGPSD